MNKAIASIRSKFVHELDSQNDFWRIYRKNTFIDLIVRDFLMFAKSQNSELLIDIFNHIIKMRMLEKIEKINLKQNLSKLSESFGQNGDELIKLYDITVSAILPMIAVSNSNNLHNNVLYLKVASNLNLDEYNEDVFDELLSNIYAFLQEAQ